MARLPDAARAEQLLPRVLAATVVAFTCGSSAVIPLLILGRLARWPLLLVLCFLALRWAAPRFPPPRALGPATLFAAALTGLAFVSTAYSVRPIVSFGRAGTLLVLFLTVGALAIGAAGRAHQVRRLLEGVLVGTIVVAVVGLILVPVDRADTIQPASPQYPARYRGLGENPNTSALLLGVMLPLVLWRLSSAETRRRRILLALTVVLFLVSIAASGSRGGLVEALAGVLVLALVAPAAPRLRLTVAAVALAAAALTLAVMRIPSPEGTGVATPPVATRNAERVLPLDGEIGRGPPDRRAPPIRRSLLTSSGRIDAWRGAVRQAGERPILGHGFGTEARVFVDRFYRFNSNSPENTYVGTLLQVGGLGLALLLGLVATLLAAGLRRARAGGTDGVMLAAALAVLAAGLVAAMTQSYLLSVGNLAVIPIWTCAFLAAGASAVRRPHPVQERERAQRREGQVEAA